MWFNFLRSTSIKTYFYLKAKIDTGATISALHATHIEEFDFKGDKYIKFENSYTYYSY